MFSGKSVLVTGGTGSFGKKFIAEALKSHSPERVIVFSRDELKQFEMSRDPAFQDKRIRYFIGDVRDRERLMRAFDGVDVVVHAAALKQVPACEYNPFEAIKTNVLGAQYIIDAAIERGVHKVIALSTDKACNPVNLYGATKLCSDKLFVAGNAYAGDKDTSFSVVRYGNVVGSRGSVIPLFMKLKSTGKLPITHTDMTRFWITLEQGVQFVMDSLDRMHGGELFVPKIPSMKMTDLARAIGPDCEIDVIGIRPGEKLHEVMISEDDARNTLEFDDHYVIQPEFGWWTRHKNALEVNGAKQVTDNFRYSSDNNDKWLSLDELKAIVAPFENEQ
jgi:UDP-N-acetylglucosamine 4,6-dehydratase